MLPFRSITSGARFQDEKAIKVLVAFSHLVAKKVDEEALSEATMHGRRSVLRHIGWVATCHDLANL